MYMTLISACISCHIKWKQRHGWFCRLLRNVREIRKGNQEWTIQSKWQHCVQWAQDEDIIIIYIIHLTLSWQATNRCYHIYTVLTSGDNSFFSLFLCIIVFVHRVIVLFYITIYTSEHLHHRCMNVICSLSTRQFIDTCLICFPN
jgi:hypothetical protein